MRHVFLINPAAGKYDRTGEFTQTIRAACEGLDYEILVSRAPGDCTHIAQAAASSGEPVRLYACGGDGTLNEVVNGAAGHAAVNICSMGFDARIGTEIGRYKRLPLVSGTGAYLLSTGVNFIRCIHEHYVVDVDGQHFDGNQTLMCIANGRYYGGSFNPVPDAEPDDGLLDVLLVRDVSRATMLRVIGKYKAGHYAQLPELIRHFRCKRVHIRCDRESEINLDGELMMSRDVTFEIAPQSIRFFYPRGLTYHAAAEQGGEHIAAT